MPANCVSITRPGKWGNPFQIGGYFKVGKGGDGTFMWLRANPEYADASFTLIETAEQAVEMYRQVLKNYPPKDIGELRGKDLACWCKEGDACHAAVLLALANGPQAPETASYLIPPHASFAEPLECLLSDDDVPEDVQ